MDWSSYYFYGVKTEPGERLGVGLEYTSPFLLSLVKTSYIAFKHRFNIRVIILKTKILSLIKFAIKWNLEN